MWSILPVTQIAFQDKPRSREVLSFSQGGCFTRFLTRKERFDAGDVVEACAVFFPLALERDCPDLPGLSKAEKDHVAESVLRRDLFLTRPFNSCMWFRHGDTVF